MAESDLYDEFSWPGIEGLRVSIKLPKLKQKEEWIRAKRILDVIFEPNQNK